MSGEFREIYGPNFFYSALEAVEDAGRHRVSQALFNLYKAIAPLERQCAWYEACDSGSYVVTLSAHKNFQSIELACAELRRVLGEESDLVTNIVREKINAP